MDQENISVGAKEEVPILFMPKQLSQSVFMNLNISTQDTEGNKICIYSGRCNLKPIESAPIETVDAKHEYTENSSMDRDGINAFANIGSTPPYESQAWIDPSSILSQHHDVASWQNTSFVFSEQHITYITDILYDYEREYQINDIGQDKMVPEARNQQLSPEIFFEGDSESEIFLSQLSKRNKNALKKHNIASTQGKNQSQSNDIGQNKMLLEAKNQKCALEIFSEDDSESEIFLSKLSKRNKTGLKKHNFASIQGNNHNN